jgi:hypothetical protein
VCTTCAQTTDEGISTGENEAGKKKKEKTENKRAPLNIFFGLVVRVG